MLPFNKPRLYDRIWYCTTLGFCDPESPTLQQTSTKKGRPLTSVYVCNLVLPCIMFQYSKCYHLHMFTSFNWFVKQKHLRIIKFQVTSKYVDVKRFSTISFQSQNSANSMIVILLYLDYNLQCFLTCFIPFLSPFLNYLIRIEGSQRVWPISRDAYSS